jgi:hypothetical protein
MYVHTIVLVGLYEEPERPPNAVDYIKQYMGAPTGVDVEALRRWVGFIFSWVDCFGYLLLDCSVISISFTNRMLALLLMTLAGLHFCVGWVGSDSETPRCNLFYVNIIIIIILVLMFICSFIKVENIGMCTVILHGFVLDKS